MTPKRPLAVGDRVRVYSGPTSFKGTVKNLDGGNKHIDGAQDIAIDRDDPSGSIAYIHPKQCRRLKPKKREMTLTELGPGQIPIDRKRLSEAWSKVVRDGASNPYYTDLVQELGLPEDTK